MPARVVVVVFVIVIAMGCHRRASPERPGEDDAVETRPPSAPAQRPAFASQTRAPSTTAQVAFKVVVIARELEHPWGLAFLPGGELLVTERPGRMRIVGLDGRLSAPVAGLPAVDARGHGGLLDVALDPAFGDNQLVYWSYAEPRDGGNGAAVARGRLVRDRVAPRVEDVEVIWGTRPTSSSARHFGSRLVFAPDGTLFVTTYGRFEADRRGLAQRLDNTLGKVVRINPDGSIPRDNPFAGRDNTLPEIYAYGHRNLQAAAIRPGTRDLWVAEHGPRGGDELNLVRPGANYGWPMISYGVHDSGEAIGVGTQHEGMEQPRYYWDPVIAPSGLAFYDAALFPAWKGSLFVGGLAGQHVARLTLAGDRVVGEERLLVDRARFRDVKVDRQGTIYLLTDDDDGELLALVPDDDVAPERTTRRRP